MLFLYSGAESLGAPQTNPLKSLGGFSSDTIIKNRLGNLFGNYSPTDVAKKKQQTFGVFIQNNDDVTHTNVSFYYIYNNAVFTLQVAAVLPDATGAIEQISSPYDSPYYATFYQANAAYSAGELIILTPPNNGNILTVMGVSTAAMSQSAPTIENAVDAIVLAYSGNSSFICTKVSANTLNFVSTVVGTNTSEITFSSTGAGSANVSYLSGGVNNKVSLSSSMVAGATIGLWLQLNVSPTYTPPSYCDINNDESLIDEMLNNLELHLVWS